MIEFNNIDEFNTIKTGSTVYISGLLGENFSFINNKYGLVKDIYLTFTNFNINYLAEVILFSDNNKYFINFDYIFKIDSHMNSSEIKSIVLQDNPFDYYRLKKNIVNSQLMHDENGQLMAICNDKNNRKHVFLYSGIN